MKQLPPTSKIEVTDPLNIFDGCLFYKHGLSVETSMPCLPPTYSTEL